MTKRTDIHRPSAIRPEDYSFVGFKCLKASESEIGEDIFFAEERRRIWKFMEKTGATYASHEHGGTCHVCGATALYLGVYHHPETNKLIEMGEDCSRKLEMGDGAAFRTFRKCAKEALKRKAGKAKAKAMLAELGLSEAYEIYETKYEWTDKPYIGEHGEIVDRDGYYSPKAMAARSVDKARGTITDIASSIVKWGDISEKKESYLRLLLTRLDAGEIEKRIAAKRTEIKPIPEGIDGTRAEITGKIVSIKEYEDSFSYHGGSVYKMLVVTDDGWKAFGSIPRYSLSVIFNVGFYTGDDTIDRSREARVKFTARFAKKDESFATFSRPTKDEIEVLEKGVAL